MNFDRMKELVLADLMVSTSSLEERRAAWIAYGNLLLACPHKGGTQIGVWVREQGLDFVTARAVRSNAKKLAERVADDCKVTEGCPFSHPTSVLQWLRDNDRIEVQSREPAAPSPTFEDDAAMPEVAPASAGAKAERGGPPRPTASMRKRSSVASRTSGEDDGERAEREDEDEDLIERTPSTNDFRAQADLVRGAAAALSTAVGGLTKKWQRPDGEAYDALISILCDMRSVGEELCRVADRLRADIRDPRRTAADYVH